MIIDIAELAASSEIETGVAIVGAGPTGLALARALARAGREVVVLESGGVEPGPEGLELDCGESVGAAGVGLTEGRARALGGAARLWAGQCLPLDPTDFEPRDWIADSGWPLAAAELDPYYERAEAFFGVEGEPYDDRVWRSFGLEPPAFDPSKLRHLATVYTPQPDLGARFEGGLRRAERVRVLTRTTVSAIVAGESGRAVEALRALGPEGREISVRAGVVVLCAGAVENARLLLLSGGLGNQHDLVGRYYQDHPNAHVATIRANSPTELLDRYGLLYRRPRRHYPKAALSVELQRRERTLNGIANLIFDFGQDSGLEALKRLYRRRGLKGASPSEVGHDLIRVAREAPALAHNLGRLRSGLSPVAPLEQMKLQVHVEQAPDRDSRVSLGAGLDPLGLPVARVDWRIGEQDLHTARTLAETVAAEFERLRLGTVELEQWLEDGDAARDRFSGAFHYAGTTRMAAAPERGVVDPNCEVFGVAGLFCCGGSVFPISGAANPTLTMVALAIRLADHLAARPSS